MCLHNTPGPNHEITLGIPNMTSISLVNLFNNINNYNDNNIISKDKLNNKELK